MILQKNNIPIWLIGAVIYLPPWLFSGHITYVQPIDVVLAVLAIYTLIKNNTKGRRPFRIRRFRVSIVFFFLLGAWVVLSQFFNIVSLGKKIGFSDMHYGITIAKYLLAFYIAFSWSDKINLRILLLMIPALVLVQVVLFYLQYYDIAGVNKLISPLYQHFVLFKDAYSRIEGRRVTGTFGNPNHSSYIMSYGMIWICSIFIYKRQVFLRSYVISAAVLSLAAVFLFTGSRSHTLIMLSVIPLSTAIFFLRKKMTILIPLLVVLVIVLMFALPHSKKYLESIGSQDRIVETFSNEGQLTQSLSNRLFVGTRHFKKAGLLQYLIGVGAKANTNQICDNGYLQMVLYGGIAILATYVVFLFVSLRFFWKHYFRAIDPDSQMISLLGLLTIMTWAVYEWVADAFWNPQLGLLFVTTLGISQGYLSGLPVRMANQFRYYGKPKTIRR